MKGCFLLVSLVTQSLHALQSMPSVEQQITEAVQAELKTPVRVQRIHSHTKKMGKTKVAHISCEPTTQTFTATLHTPENKEMTLKGRFTFQQNVPVLKTALPRNTLLKEADVTWHMCDSSSRTRGALAPKQMAGRMSTHDLAPGMILTTFNSKKQNKAIKVPRGAPVTLCYHSDHITIRAQGGRLAKAGIVGATVEVFSPFARDKNKALRGRLISVHEVHLGTV